MFENSLRNFKSTIGFNANSLNARDQLCLVASTHSEMQFFGMGTIFAKLLQEHKCIKVSVFATCDMTYMHLCSCKSIEKIVPIQKIQIPQFWYLFLIIGTDSLISFEILIHQCTIQFMGRPDPLYMTLLSGSILDFVERFSLQALKTFFRNFFNIYGYG